MTVPRVSPLEAKERIDLGFAILVDIREPDAYAREHVEGSVSLPLAEIESYELHTDRMHPVVIYMCESGNDACIHFRRLAAAAVRECYVMAGGIAAWKAAGLTTSLDRTVPIEIRRQAIIAEGAAVMLGILLASTVSPWFIVLPVSAACEMVFAGVCGWSFMTKLLGSMPWNSSVR